MKKILLTLLIIAFLIPGIAFGQTPSEGESLDENASTKDNIDEIKDKVTTQIEKLDLVEKRGLIGEVENVTDKQIRINDLNDKIRIIEVDELTKYSSQENNTFELSDIDKGSEISVMGIYNKESEKLLARFLNEVSIPIFLTGVIVSKNDEEFTFVLATEDEKNFTIDIENITKTFSFSDIDLGNSGFTEIKPMQNAIVTGFSSPDDENKISATRVVIFPDIPKNPRIYVETSEPTKEIIASPTP